MSLFARGRHAAPLGSRAIPSSDDTPVDRLEVHMLAAIAKGDAALNAYVETRDVQMLIDGWLDVRNRLTKGLPR